MFLLCFGKFGASNCPIPLSTRLKNESPRAAAQRLGAGALDMPVFDTTALIDLTRHKPSMSRQALDGIIQGASDAGEQLCTTRFNMAEMYTGLELSLKPAVERAALELISRLMIILDFDDRAARCFGAIDARLRRAGRPIDDMDMLIASVAQSHQLPLVTRNPRHFFGIPDLDVIPY
jgi:tRNA(fMet)-specific endonuclease VapC